MQFFICTLFGKVLTQIYSKSFVWRRHVGSLPRGTNMAGGHTITEMSVIEFCYWNEKLLLELEFRHIKSSNSSSARTVQLAKTWVITPLLTYVRALLGCHFNVTQRMNLEIQTSSITIWRTLSSFNIVKCQLKTKTLEELVGFNFGKWWHHRTQNSDLALRLRVIIEINHSSQPWCDFFCFILYALEPS